jgi:hypothetical protein
MDHVAKSIMQAYQEIKEKSLSAKQKKLDKDKDGDIDGDDFASMRNDKKRQQSEEAPAAPIKKAPARKGDKSNSDVGEGVISKYKAHKKAKVQKKKDAEYDKKNAEFLKRSGKRDSRGIDIVMKSSDRGAKGDFTSFDNPSRAAHNKRMLDKTSSRIKNGHKLPRLPEEVEQVDEGPLSNAADDRLGRDFSSNMRIPKTSAAKKYLRKKQADKNAEINKNDPKTAKQGYGRSIVDVQKALSKAKKKGKDTEKLKKGLGWRQRNSAQKSKLPSDKK